MWTGIWCNCRTTLKDGKIDQIYIVSEGENYPVSDQNEQVIESVNIIFPGGGYSDGDTVTDNFGNEYDVTVQQGLITKVTPITQIKVDDVPILSATGSGNGAILSANLNDRPEFQGEVKQVIDCVS